MAAEGGEQAVEHSVGEYAREAGEHGCAPAAVVAAVGAADRAQDEFFAIVGDVVGARHVKRFTALLLTSAYRITGMEVSGHFSAERWRVPADGLVSALVTMIDR
ncbi:hypothetical protein [Amycolatopsis jejuensis]|uniref:hypothetical protein n=1 Tax=Amycolatopsis jejuensis TaxID=330084 RepID=UPI00068AC0EA|nr:hypothetical protein [Amycolatopsis jejuensis]